MIFSKVHRLILFVPIFTLLISCKTSSKLIEVGILSNIYFESELRNDLMVNHFQYKNSFDCWVDKPLDIFITQKDSISFSVTILDQADSTFDIDPYHIVFLNTENEIQESLPFQYRKTFSFAIKEGYETLGIPILTYEYVEISLPLILNEAFNN